MPRERAPGPRRHTRALVFSCAVLGFGLLLTPSCGFPDYDFVDQIAQGGEAASDAGAGGDPLVTGGAGGEPSGSGAGGLGGASGHGATEPGGGAGGAAGEGPTAGAGGSDPGVLFEDDFESGNDGWFETHIDWSVVMSDGSMVYRQPTDNPNFVFAIAGEEGWTDVIVQARMRVLSFGGTSTSDLASVHARYAGEDDSYYLALRGDGAIALRKRSAGANSTLGTPENVSVQEGVWHDVELRVIGDTLEAYFDGELKVTATDTTEPIHGAGRIALGTDNATAEFDDVVVRLP